MSKMVKITPTEEDSELLISAIRELERKIAEYVDRLLDKAPAVHPEAAHRVWFEAYLRVIATIASRACMAFNEYARSKAEE